KLVGRIRSENILSLKSRIVTVVERPAEAGATSRVRLRTEAAYAEKHLMRRTAKLGTKRVSPDHNHFAFQQVVIRDRLAFIRFHFAVIADDLFFKLEFLLRFFGFFGNALTKKRCDVGITVADSAFGHSLEYAVILDVSAEKTFILHCVRILRK